MSLYDDKIRSVAFKDLTSDCNSHECICEKLRQIYDEVYNLPEIKIKSVITEYLVDAFIMGKKMAERLTYYKEKYSDDSGNDAINLLMIPDSLARKQMRRNRL